MLSKVTPVLPSDTSDESFFLFHNFQYLFFPYEFNIRSKTFFILLSYCSVVLKKRIESIHANFCRLFLHNLVFQPLFAFFYSIGVYYQIASIVTHFINAQVVMKIRIQAHNHTIQKAYRSNICNFTFYCIIEKVPI